MAGQCDFLERGPCGQFHERAGGFRLDDLQMSKHHFDYLVTTLNSKLRDPSAIEAPMTQNQGAFLCGAGVFLFLAEGVAFPPMAVLALAAGTIADTALPTQEDARQRYDQDVRDARQEAEQFFSTEFVEGFRAYGFAVDLDEGCENIFTTKRLTFHLLGNTIQREGNAAAPSEGVQGDVAAVLDGHRGGRRGHRQRRRAKQFWNSARVSTPDALD
mmetsp:Transcript_119096/g.337607  ORF Transcript_119096/g.337607 Transcript_119096/m.337607 type:complete len:215 (-) Transcript_119096:3-647(-)